MELMVGAVQCKVGSRSAFTSAEKLIEIGIDKNVRVFLLPEYFSYSPGGVDLERTKETLKFLQKLSAEHKCVIAGNAIVKGKNGYFNALHVFKDGELKGVQEKVHPTENERKMGIKSGNAAKTFEIEGVRFGSLVCADILYPEYCRVLGLRNVDVAFNPVVSIEKSELPAKELRHCLYFTRSFDNAYAIIKAGGPGVTLLGSKAAGRSLISSPSGIEAIYSNENAEELVYAGIDLEKIRRHRRVNYSLFDRNLNAYRGLLDREEGFK